MQAYAWLRREISPQDLLLTTFDPSGQGSGGRIVAATGQRVYAGHWIETAFLLEKVRLLHRFYDSEADDLWRRRFLLSLGAAYVWYDESARALGEWDPATVSYLELAFESGELQIYRVSIPQ
jgi:hypothetical protein